MPSASLRRRLRNLEASFALALAPPYAPFSRSELDSIEARTRMGEILTRVELQRLEQQGNIIDGEFLITCHRGQVFVKRYIGIDLAEI